MLNKSVNFIKVALSLSFLLFCFLIEKKFNAIHVESGAVISTISVLIFIWSIELNKKKVFWGGILFFFILYLLIFFNII